MTSRLEERRCLYCEEPLTRDPTEVPADSVDIHSWCLALCTGGHNYGYCGCTNYQGLTQREAARVVVGLIRMEDALTPGMGDDPERIDWERLGG